MFTSPDKRIINRKTSIFEFYIWLVVGILICLPEILYMISYMGHYSYEEFILQTYNKLLLTFGVIIFPVLFKLIFGVLPLEAIRNRREGSKIEKEYKNIKKQEIEKREDVLSEENRENHILEFHLNEANTLANKIYSRAGAYLLVGCLIAFAGIFIFYSPLFDDKINYPENPGYLGIIFNYLPRFGAMIFIELIAFFFLNQYKIMMEEFRYYERIKRRRQDNLAILKLVEDSKDEETLKKILEFCVFEASTTRELNSDTTTEILEVYKQNGDDLRLFDRVIELTKAIKGQ